MKVSSGKIEIRHEHYLLLRKDYPFLAQLSHSANATTFRKPYIFIDFQHV